MEGTLRLSKQDGGQRQHGHARVMPLPRLSSKGKGILFEKKFFFVCLQVDTELFMCSHSKLLLRVDDRHSGVSAASQFL